MFEDAKTRVVKAKDEIQAYKFHNKGHEVKIPKSVKQGKGKWIKDTKSSQSHGVEKKVKNATKYYTKFARRT